MKDNRVLTGSLCALGCEVLYGLSYLFTKQTAETASPLALLGWRFVVALAAMSLCVALDSFQFGERQTAGPLRAWRCSAVACISSAKRWAFAKRR